MKLQGSLCAVVLLAGSAAAFGQIDTEPANNTAFGGDNLFPGFTPFNSARVNVAGLGAGDVDFFNFDALTGDVMVGVTTPLGVPFNSPDTLMQFWDGIGGVPVGPINDDAGSHNVPGSTRGSAVRARMPQTGNWSFGVTGFGDPGFIGAHAETGPYAVTIGRFPINAAPGTGDFADVAANNVFAGASSLNLAGAGSAVAATASLDATAPDVDFYSVDLFAGDILTAITVPLGLDFNSPDTLLAVYDAGGTQLVLNDDGGSDFAPGGVGVPRGSVVRFLAPASGRYYVGVTGFNDSGFAGAHSLSGPYGLAASIIPAPGATGLAAVGLLALARRRRS